MEYSRQNVLLKMDSSPRLPRKQKIEDDDALCIGEFLEKNALQFWNIKVGSG